MGEEKKGQGKEVAECDGTEERGKIGSEGGIWHGQERKGKK